MLGQRRFVLHFRWANVGPMWLLHVYVVFSLRQRWANVGLYHTSIGPTLGQRRFVLHFRWANVVVTRICCIFIAPTLGQHGFVLHFHWANVVVFSLGQHWANAYLFNRCFLLGQCVLILCAETLDISYVVYKQYACNENIGLGC